MTPGDGGNSHDALMSLQIEPVVRRAEQIVRMVQAELPQHTGIIRAADGVAHAAREAERVTRSLRRILNPHRLPVYFLAISLSVLLLWCYWNFFRVTRLTVALPDRDAVVLRRALARRAGIDFEERFVDSSADVARLVESGDADLGFVQGGVPFDDNLLSLELPGQELVLFLTRPHITRPSQIRTVLTSLHDAGSHTVAQQFFTAWQVPGPIKYIHNWSQLAEDASGNNSAASQLAESVPADVDAVFVVKDPGNEKALLACRRLQTAGFQLRSPDLGARDLQLRFLRRTQVPVGYLNVDPALPAEPVMTYSVKDYLIARRGLTPRLLGTAAHLFDGSGLGIESEGLEANLENTSEILQGTEAFLSIVVYIGLAFLTLLGVEMMTYRRRFNELDTLISLISMHQSDKDVLAVDDPDKLHRHLKYLSICSDLLGLISVIAGYYTQENGSLLYNNLLGIIHDRSSSMKLNIQLKILHASIVIPDRNSTDTPERSSLTPIQMVAIPESGPVDAVLQADEQTAAVISQTQEQYAESGYEPPWGGYLAVHDGHVVGTCAFKTAPKDGAVEIACFTFPEFTGRNIATRMVSALVTVAREHTPDVVLIANTLPVESASTSVLKKLGFDFSGLTDDPADGRVWRWELSAS